MSSTSSFGGNENRQRRLPKMDNLKRQAQLEPITRKLTVAHKEVAFGNMHNRRAVNLPGDQFFQKIADNTATNISDATNLMQLIPEMEMIKQIYISTTLSPKDMADPKLTYKVLDGIFDSEISGLMIDVVASHFSEVYKIDHQLPEWLEECLYTHGAKPLLILAESVVDDVINDPTRASMESLRAETDGKWEFLSIGLLGHGNNDSNPVAHVSGDTGVSFAMESYSRAAMENTRRFAPEKINIFNGIAGAEEKFGKIRVSDNPEVMKMPLVQDAIQQRRLNQVMTRTHSSKRKLLKPSKFHASLESEQIFDGRVAEGDRIMSTFEVQTQLYGRRTYRSMPVNTLRTRDQLDRRTVGHPLVMKLPTESVIPVFVPSQPEDHIGYFILLDEMGAPINKVNQKDYYAEMNANVNANNDMVSQLIKTTARGVNGAAKNNEIDPVTLLKAYSDIVEEDLLARLRTGIYGDHVKIGRPDEVYRLMLTRTMANQDTRILYVPADLMCYLALDYNQFGIGRSRMEDTKILASMRAILLFASTMAAMKNSVGRTRLNIKLSQEDDDPSGTVEFLIHEYAKNRQSAYPLGASNPLDIISFLQNAGVEVNVTGNDGYPDTEVSAEDFSSNKVKPDTELDALLNERLSNAHGVPVELINTAKGPEFATTAARNHLLLSKRTSKDQSKFVVKISEFIRKYTYNDGTLLEALREIVKSNKDKLSDDLKHMVLDAGDELNVDNVVKLFIDSIFVELPKAELASVAVQIEAFEEYSKGLDATLPAYINQDMFGLGGSDVEGAASILLAVAKADYQRKFLRDNNIMPELFDLCTFDEAGGPAVNMLQRYQDHLEGITKTFGELFDNAKRLAAMREKKAEALGIQSPDTPPADTGDTGAGTGTDEFGLEETGTGEDTTDTDTGTEETTEQTSTEETTEETPEGEEGTDTGDEGAAE